ncbi:hypothetical protein GGX14DRAFT_404407 [Mycena pura]|uniref:Uncharacterized protein n=1 Tax=Mycena pura TaxID=153505 RepID=A0AAD6UY26_9AGAR|nr:hypothetical protein GGX14DRAFT_404407 [Mycena pura]
MDKSEAAPLFSLGRLKYKSSFHPKIGTFLSTVVVIFLHFHSYCPWFTYRSFPKEDCPSLPPIKFRLKRLAHPLTHHKLSAHHPDGRNSINLFTWTNEDGRLDGEGLELKFKWEWKVGLQPFPLKGLVNGKQLVNKQLNVSISATFMQSRAATTGVILRRSDHPHLGVPGPQRQAGPSARLANADNSEAFNAAMRRIGPLWQFEGSVKRKLNGWSLNGKGRQDKVGWVARVVPEGLMQRAVLCVRRSTCSTTPKLVEANMVITESTNHDPRSGVCARSTVYGSTEYDPLFRTRARRCEEYLTRVTLNTEPERLAEMPQCRRLRGKAK